MRSNDEDMNHLAERQHGKVIWENQKVCGGKSCEEENNQLSVSRGINN